MECPREDHWAAIKHVLHYIKGSCDCGIIFPKDCGSVLQLKGYKNSNMAGDVDSQKSTSSMFFLLSLYRLAIAEAEGGRAINLRGGVHRSGHIGLPRILALQTAVRAHQ